LHRSRWARRARSPRTRPWSCAPTSPALSSTETYTGTSRNTLAGASTKASGSGPTRPSRIQRATATTSSPRSRSSTSRCSAGRAVALPTNTTGRTASARARSALR
jgi:hypothetical protein